MIPINRTTIAELISRRLRDSAVEIRVSFEAPGKIQSAIIDDLLPSDLANEIASSFPQASQMREAKSVHEHKFTAKQLNQFSPLIEEATFAFQEPIVIDTVAEITGLHALKGDPTLYAGGISAMADGHFLLPHLDNSHDAALGNYRVLNLLYYVTPEWEPEFGGNLELWDNGPEGEPREIVSRFNRLVLMATHQKSWHSVNEVHADKVRTCISNYYFSEHSLFGEDYFHVTSFRAPHGKGVRDLVLRADNLVRNAVRHVAPQGIYKPELYAERQKKGGAE